MKESILMTHAITASCECRALRFRTESPPVLQLVCHCKDCRTATGEPFSQIAFFNLQSVEISGPREAKEFQASSGNRTRRELCKECGTVMFDLSEGFPNLIGIMGRRIDKPFEFSAACHVWTDSRLLELEIPEGARQFAGNFKR